MSNNLINTKLILALLSSMVFLISRASRTDSLINAGLLSKAEYILLSKPNSIEKHTLLGNIYFEKGYLDKALDQWMHSIDLRKLKYSETYYQSAWNYALLAKYYTERINPTLAVKYADSCESLLYGLEPDEQKILEIWKIWNILGQCYKLKRGNTNPKLHSKIYAEVRGYYEKSVTFIKENKLPKIHLAHTFHLIGNTHNDQMWSSNKTNSSEAINHYDKANYYYDRAIQITRNRYGNTHPQIAISYLTKGLLNIYAPKNKGINTDSLAQIGFEKSVEAFHGGDQTDNFSKIDFKKDYLMASHYLRSIYFKLYKTKKSEYNLDKLTILTDKSIEIWNQYYNESKKVSANLNLAIYRLLPFSSKLSLQVLKNDKGELYNPDSLFTIIQHYKAYDVVNSSKLSDLQITVTQVQNNLRHNECYVDFIILHEIDKILATVITKEENKVFELPNIETSLYKELSIAITTKDFKNYITTASILYKKLIEPLKIEKNSQLTICPDGALNEVPFEAFLCSDYRVKTKDYRLLDYLIKKYSVRYILAPQLLLKTTIDKIEFTINAFQPSNRRNESFLPFNRNLVENLDQEYDAMSFKDDSASRKLFFNSDASILHIGGHASIDRRYFENSHISFSDGILKPQDIGLIKQKPSLIVINACNSSLGKIYQGEGIDGFTRYARASGIKSTLVNLWEVDDKASSKILAYFYSQLSEGKNTVSSLKTAKLNYLTSSRNSDQASPYYWAAHKLTGENTIYQEQKSLFWLWILLGISLAFVIIYSPLVK